jgi:uncharacterized membrane protein
VIPSHTLPSHPALRAHDEERRASIQNRIADGITRFAGSMAFVYVHVVWFVLWIALGVEKYPFGLLTMIVSLEAIFLSTFVLISQNRAEAKGRRMAEEEWRLVQVEDSQNEELLSLTRQTLELTKEIHRLSAASGLGPPPRTAGGTE